MNIAETTPYDPRALIACMECGVILPYRLVRDADRFLRRHRGHEGILILRDRRPGWRKTAQRR